MKIGRLIQAAIGIRNEVKAIKAERSIEEAAAGVEDDAPAREPRFRTSTKAGAAVLAPLAIILPAIPYYDQIAALADAACKADQGPVVFLTGYIGAGLIAFVTARLSKTKINPGAL